MFLKWREFALLGIILSYMKNLLINHPVIFSMRPLLKRFLTFFYLVAEDLYNEGVIGNDGLECQTLCNLRMYLVGLVGCEDSPIIIIKIKHIC